MAGIVASDLPYAALLAGIFLETVAGKGPEANLLGRGLCSPTLDARQAWPRLTNSHDVPKKP